MGRQEGGIIVDRAKRHTIYVSISNEQYKFIQEMKYGYDSPKNTDQILQEFIDGELNDWLFRQCGIGVPQPEYS